MALCRSACGLVWFLMLVLHYSRGLSISFVFFKIHMDWILNSVEEIGVERRKKGWRADWVGVQLDVSKSKSKVKNFRVSATRVFSCVLSLSLRQPHRTHSRREKVGGGRACTQHGIENPVRPPGAQPRAFTHSQAQTRIFGISPVFYKILVVLE